MDSGNHLGKHAQGRSRNDVATMLNLFQLAGHYTSQHGPFHDLRDSLLRETRYSAPTGSRCPFPRWAIGYLPLAFLSWGVTPQQVMNCSLESPTIRLQET